MPSYQNGTNFEIWIATDSGQRLAILDLAGPFTYTWAANNIGFFSIPLPVGFDRTLLAKDRRVYIWRRPEGRALYLDFEGFLRIIDTSTDTQGNTSRLIQGPDLNYLLSGKVAAYPDDSTKVDTTATPVAADDLLKSIVANNVGANSVTSNGRKADGYINSAYFSIAANLTLGPTISKAFSYRNVLDALREVCDASRTAGTELYFDLVPAIEDGTQHTMEFRTYTGQSGKDRTSDSAGGGLTFGLEFGNLAEPHLVEDAMDEVTRVYALGQGQGSARDIQYSEDVTRQTFSQFAMRESVVQALSSTTTAATLDAADAALVAGRPRSILTAKLLSVDGFIYGKDWYRGDRVTITYDGRQVDALVRTVTISVDGNGKETIDAAVEGVFTVMPGMDVERRLRALEAALAAIKAGPSGVPLSSTWTPAWTGTGTAGVFTYTTRAGFYAQMGKLVYFWGQMIISAIGTPPVGNMTITGLPITSSSTANSFGSVYFGQLSQLKRTAASKELQGFVGVSSTTITLRESFDNVASVAYPAANFTNAAASILLAGFYLAA